MRPHEESLGGQDLLVHRIATRQGLACVAVLQATTHCGVALVAFGDDPLEQVDKGLKHGSFRQGPARLHGLYPDKVGYEKFTAAGRQLVSCCLYPDGFRSIGPGIIYSVFFRLSVTMRCSQVLVVMDCLSVGILDVCVTIDDRRVVILAVRRTPVVVVAIEVSILLRTSESATASIGVDVGVGRDRNEGEPRPLRRPGCLFLFAIGSLDGSVLFFGAVFDGTLLPGVRRCGAQR